MDKRERFKFLGHLLPIVRTDHIDDPGDPVADRNAAIWLALIAASIFAIPVIRSLSSH